MSGVDISIIVVTWNAMEHIDTCLKAVFKAIKPSFSVEVIVVDNDSEDQTVEYTKSNWPNIKIINTGTNLGMAFGNNVGMLAAEGKNFLLLNSDCFLDPDALDTMLGKIKELDGNKKIGALVPALYNLDGSLQKSVRGFPSVWRYLTEFLYLRKIAPNSRLLNSFYGGGLDLSLPQNIDWATGACLFVPRAAVDTVGLMDEAYFMYGEEVDWLYRMSLASLPVFWLPQAKATHVGGGSAKKVWGDLYQKQVINHVRYMLRCKGIASARRTKLILVLSLRIRTLVYRLVWFVCLGNRRTRVKKRMRSFIDARKAVSSIDFNNLSLAKIPEWPAKHQ